VARIGQVLDRQYQQPSQDHASARPALDRDASSNEWAAPLHAGYVDYYAMLPLPRGLKPFAPWIMSGVMILFVSSLSMCAQWCAAQHAGPPSEAGHAPSRMRHLIKGIFRALFR